MTRYWALIAMLAFVVACDRVEPPGRPTLTNALTPTPDAIEPPADQPSSEVPPAITEADVQPVLDEWLRSQNEGDFEAYSNLYASPFEGIKRVGPRVYRYDRVSWLEDRERMFKKKIKVSAADVAISTTESVAAVALQQTWASGAFRDAGPKRLVIVPTASGLKIAKEEMLRSSVSDGDGGAPHYDPEVFTMLVSGRVALDVAPKLTWATGPARLEVRPDPTQTTGTVVRSVDVPQTAYGAWVGREFELFDGVKKVCDTKIESLEMIARTVPPYELIGEWSGGDDGSGPRESDAAVAGSLWRFATAMAQRNVQLVGKLSQACEGALWGRPKGSAASPMHGSGLSGPRQREIVSSFTDLPPYHARQTDYDASGRKGAWHADDGALTQFIRFGDWIVGSAESSYGCGGFEAALSSIWRASALGGFIVESEQVDVPWSFFPTAAVRNGEHVYFLDSDQVVTQHGDGWASVWDTRPVIWACGC